MRQIASRYRLGVAIAVVALAGSTGCAAPAVSTSAPPEPAPSSSATAEPTPNDTPQSAPSTSPSTSSSLIAAPAATFKSPFYRYAITLPAGTATRAWRGADRRWDGAAKLDMASPYLDRTGVGEHSFWLFGAEDPGLETWFARVEANGKQFHGCTPAENRVDVAINGTPAIAFTQSCEEETHMARVALWKDGYGLGVWLGPTEAAKLVAVRDRAIELLAPLEWTPG